MRNKLVKKIQNIGEFSFEEVALSVFRYQAQSNPLYAKFLDLLSIDFQQIAAIEQIPFLPIALFKQYSIKTGQWPSEAVFTSSGTTGQTTSRHEIRSLDWYRQLSIQGFEQQYGPLTQYCILALLPSYLERSGSSLVYMAEQFIRQSPYPSSGFFLYDTQKLLQVLQECQTQQIPTLLIGVSFALLDLAQQHPINLEGITIMETGGMKGRRQEITRQELHDQLKMAFRVSTIHSEYGMTELLSQAYSPGEGRFYGMPSMQVHCREVTDPLHLQEQGKSGLLNIIDLANLDTCSFIATDDLGIVHKDGSFEVLGRLDHSDIRG
ncbi:MAG: acyl transferase, partial [Bacteroidota bacterium]